MTKTYEIQCDPVCGFHLKTHNEKEAIRMGMEHVADAHPEMKVTTAEMKKNMKSM